MPNKGLKIFRPRWLKWFWKSFTFNLGMFVIVKIEDFKQKLISTEQCRVICKNFASYSTGLGLPARSF